MKDWQLLVPERPAEIYQDVVDDYLADLLARFAIDENKATVRTTSLLAGVARQGNYGKYFEDEERTYVLASAVLNYLEEYAEDAEIDALLKDDICTMLNLWLKPAIDCVVPPSAMAAAIEMFGSAWCSLFASRWQPQYVAGIKACEDYMGFLIYQERPPFLPGLCPAQQQPQSAPLPPNLG